MRALSIRQPYAELILRQTCGQQINPIEFRPLPTRIISSHLADAVSGWLDDDEG